MRRTISVMTALLMAVAFGATFVACHDTPGTWGHHSGSDLPNYNPGGSSGGSSSSSSSSSSGSNAVATVVFSSRDAQANYINVDGGHYQTATLNGNSTGGSITLSNGTKTDLTGTYGTVALAAVGSTASSIEGTWNVSFSGVSGSYRITVKGTNFYLYGSDNSGTKILYSAKSAGDFTATPAPLEAISTSSVAGKTFVGARNENGSDALFTVTLASDGQTGTGVHDGNTATSVTYDGDILSIFVNENGNSVNRYQYLYQVSGKKYCSIYKLTKTDGSSGLAGVYVEDRGGVVTVYNDGRLFDARLESEPGVYNGLWGTWTCDENGWFVTSWPDSNQGEMCYYYSNGALYQRSLYFVEQ